MKKIEPDKWKHFYVGIILGVIVFSILYFFAGFQPPTVIVLSVGIVVSISYMFELFSLVTGNGHYEMMDAIASIIGGLTGVGAVLLLLKILH